MDPDLGRLVWLAMALVLAEASLCALRWRHVDPDEGVLVVRASIAQAHGETWEKDTKLHQRRHIALDRTTIAVLAKYYEERQRRAAVVGAVLPLDGFVFSPHVDGRVPRSPNAVSCQY
jgi:integrase